MGRTRPRPAPAASTKATICRGTETPSAPATAATAAATAISPRVSVTVSSSTTPSTAAKISQMIQVMAAPHSSAATAATPLRTVRLSPGVPLRPCFEGNSGGRVPHLLTIADCVANHGAAIRLTVASEAR